KHRTIGHHDDGDAAGADGRNRQSLPFDMPQIAQELVVKYRHLHHARVLAGLRLGFVCTFAIRPFAKNATRSPISAMATLCVMMTEVVPSSTFMRSIA